MTLNLIAKWVLTASLSWLALPAPTQRCPFSNQPELHGRTIEGVEAHRASILSDIVEVAFDATEAPVFDEPHARAKTALFMASIARFESGYDLLVDTGEVVGPQGEVCVMQVMIDWRYQKGVGMLTREGWSKADLIADRKKCVRAALHKLQVSRAICSNAKDPQNVTKKALVGADQFSIYTGGKCAEGSTYALHRHKPVEAWIAKSPVPSASASR